MLLAIVLATLAQLEPQTITAAIFVDCGVDPAAPANIEEALGANHDPTILFVSARVDAASIRAGALEGFDVVIFPGGSASTQASALGVSGRNAVRAFVAGGGGYVGICAGAYLASCEPGHSFLHLINAVSLDIEHWDRGTGFVAVQLAGDGGAVFSDTCDGRIEPLLLYYGQGPLLAPAQDPELPEFTLMATYRSEIVKNDAIRGVMLGAGAIAGAPYGAGRVLAMSPHPEKTVGRRSMVRDAVVWAANAER